MIIPLDSVPRHISIHAPARGATTTRGVSLCLRKISIHAPARGATAYGRALPQSIARFQSTRPRGARLSLTFKLAGLPVFQSTRPRGARQCHRQRRRFRRNFNPRAREGRDYDVDEQRDRDIISIHAPARGATSRPYSSRQR